MIAFQGRGVEKIHMHISRGNIIELDETETKFHFSDSIEEIAVIHGSVRSPITGDMFHSPALILPEHDTVCSH